MLLRNRVDHLLHPSMGEIWCLHRVVPVRSIYPSNRELEITPSYLEQLIKDQLARGVSFVTLDAIVSDVVSGSFCILKKKQVNISFDDGFHDIYEHAFPIFKKFNVPFTIYLTVGFPLGMADIWWVQLEQLVNGDVDLYEKIMRDVRNSDKNMRDLMHEKTSSVPDLEMCRDLSLSWDQLKEMIDSGLCAIGSHTMTHPCLTRISKEDVLWELYESKRIIQDYLRVNVRHFSYPHSMGNDMVISALRKTGYETAALGYGGKLRKNDSVFRLSRKYILQES